MVFLERIIFRALVLLLTIKAENWVYNFYLALVLFVAVCLYLV